MREGFGVNFVINWLEVFWVVWNGRVFFIVSWVVVVIGSFDLEGIELKIFFVVFLFFEIVFKLVFLLIFIVGVVFIFFVIKMFFVCMVGVDGCCVCVCLVENFIVVVEVLGFFEMFLELFVLIVCFDVVLVLGKIKGIFLIYCF